MHQQHVVVDLLFQYSIMLNRIILFNFLIFILPVSFSLNLSELVPTYLFNGNNGPNSGADPNMPVKPLINPHRNTTKYKDNTWYCNGEESSENINVANNIFCQKNTTIDNRNVILESSNVNDIRGKVVDNSVGNAGQVMVKSYSNQQTMQDQQVRNTINRAQNSFSVPLQPNDDVKLNIGQQQIQLNIKY